MPLPHELPAFRAPLNVNSDGGQSAALAAQTGQYIGEAQRTGLAGLGAGIASGISQIGEHIERRRLEGRQDAQIADQRQYEREALLEQHRLSLERQTAALGGQRALADDARAFAAEQDERDTGVLRHIQRTSAQQLYGEGLPAPEQSARAAYDHRMGSGSFDRLPEIARQRMAAIAGTMAGEMIDVLPESQEAQRALDASRPDIAARVKSGSVRLGEVPQHLGQLLMERSMDDPAIHQSIIADRLARMPEQEARTRGEIPLADAFASTRGDVPTQESLAALWTVGKTGSVNVDGASVPLLSLVAGKGNITPTEVEALQGKRTFYAPAWMVDTQTGKLRDDPATVSRWINSQDDIKDYLGSLAGRLPPQELHQESKKHQAARDILRGINGANGHESNAPEGLKAAIGAFRRKYGEAAATSMVARQFLAMRGDLRSTTLQGTPVTKEMEAAWASVEKAIRPGLKVDGVSVTDPTETARYVGNLVMRDSSQTTQFLETGPLSQLANLPPAQVAAAWNHLSQALKKDPAWGEIQSMTAASGLPEETRGAVGATAYGQFQAARPLLESSLQPGGKRWDELSGAEQGRQLRELGSKLVRKLSGDVLPTPEARVFTTPDQRSPQYDTRSAQTLLERHGLKDAGGMVKVKDGEHTYTFENGRLQGVTDINGRSVATAPFGAAREVAWVPAQTIFKGNLAELGKTGGSAPIHAKWLTSSRMGQVPDSVKTLLGYTKEGVAMLDQLASTLHSGEGSALRTAYEGVHGAIRNVAGKMGVSVGHVMRDIQAAGMQHPTDPILPALAAFLEEGNHPDSIGYDDRQLERSIPNPGTTVDRVTIDQQLLQSGAPQVGDQGVGSKTAYTTDPQPSWADRAFGGGDATSAFVRQFGMGIPQAAAGALQAGANAYLPMKSTAAAQANEVLAKAAAGETYYLPGPDGQWQAFRPGDPGYGQIPEYFQDAEQYDAVRGSMWKQPHAPRRWERPSLDFPGQRHRRLP